MPEKRGTMQIEKVKPKLRFNTGLSDEAYIDGKLIGYVGFHECDTPVIPNGIVRLKCHNIAEKLQTQIIVSKTLNGYHFDDFEILTKDERDEWGEMMQWEFPGDYLQFNRRKITPFHHILRISKKAPNGEPHDIRFNTMYELLKNPHRKLSGGHITQYMDQKIIPFKYFQHRLEDIADTEAMLVIYPTLRNEGEEK